MRQGERGFRSIAFTISLVALRGYCPERRAAAVGRERGIDRWMDGASVLEREQPAYHAWSG